MSEDTNSPKPPSPEVTQLVLLGQVDDAVALHAKQAEIDHDAARDAIDSLVD